MSLLFEIIFAQFSRHRIRQMLTPLSNECRFSYQSKCADLKDVRKQFCHLHLCLLCDGYVKITRSEVCYKNFQLSMSLEFELKNSQKLDEITDKFHVFTVYLDSISQT